jgi:transposase
VFRNFAGLCAKIEFYGKELAAIDGSKFKAVNSKERNCNAALKIEIYYRLKPP